VTALKQFLLRQQASLTVLLLATILILAALRWMGYDLTMISKAFIGNGGDTLANSWAVYQALDNLLHRPFNLGYSTIFYGEHDSFFFTIAPYGIAVVVLPIYLLSGGNLELTYNLYWIATFALTAWAVYLLVQYLLRVPHGAAVLLGLSVAFAQFRFLHIGHIETLSMQFYVLGIYCLHRLLDKPGPRWSIPLAMAFWFTQVTSGYLGVTFVLTAAIIVGFAALRHRSRFTKRLTFQLTLATAIAALITLPFLLFRFQNPVFQKGYSFNELLTYSATLQDWFLGTSQIYMNVLRWKPEVTLFLGFTPLLLAIIAWRWRKRGDILLPEGQRLLTRQDTLVVYGLLVIVGYLLTLGPVLKINDSAVMPLPYLILMQLPGFQALRVPARFLLMTLLGVAVLGGHTFALLRVRTDDLTFWAVIAGVSIVLTIELIPFNGNPSNRILDSQPTSARVLQAVAFKEKIPPVYDWLRQQPSGTPIVHYPVSFEAGFQYLAYEPYHNQPVLNGYGSFYPDWYWTTNWSQFPEQNIIDFLVKRGIRYVLIHRDLLTPEAYILLKEQLSSPDRSSAVQFVNTFDETDVYKIISGQ
jgi:hypothetical protein